MTNINIHHFLVSGYLYNEALYTFSFADRVQIELGMLEFTPSSCRDELVSLSDDKLINKRNNLKKPWWNDIYRKELHHQVEKLLAIYSHLQDKELKMALEAKDSERLMRFIKDIVEG